MPGHAAPFGRAGPEAGDPMREDDRYRSVRVGLCQFAARGAAVPDYLPDA